MNHFKLIVNGIDGLHGDCKNIFYCRQDAAVLPPPFSNIIGLLYTPVNTWLSSNFSIETVDWSVWEGPESGEWYEVGSDGKKHPKAAPPWSAVRTIIGGRFAGIGTGNALPPQVAVCMVSNVGVKHVIAKKYYGSLDSAVNDNGDVAADALTDFGTVCDNWGGGFHDGISDYPAEVWGPITGFHLLGLPSTDLHLATQRRRKSGVGS